MATSCITHPCSDEWQEEVVKWSFMNGDVVQQFPKGHVSLVLGSIGSKHLVQKIKAFRYPKIFFLHCSKNKLNLPRKNRACWSRCNDICPDSMPDICKLILYIYSSHCIHSGLSQARFLCGEYDYFAPMIIIIIYNMCL